METPTTPNSKNSSVNYTYQEESPNITHNDIPSSPPMSVLNQLMKHQQARSTKLMKPFSSSSSPPNSESDDLSPSRPNKGRGKYYHHPVESSRSQNFNLRNKHDKIRQVRNQHRHDKLMISREKINDQQFKRDINDQYEKEYEHVTDGLDIDRLIEDEQENTDTQVWLQHYEEEAEEREWEEDADLIDMIQSLEIEDKTMS
ncbi:conserved hypothetical protein [Candida dubliniensis CD36]|uniref:Uncharacterized protein n=1 Tax=Candida dubliniensis (strain CD36 / ATCC MYA-646 / CBS 7987 / NCPF 3949 / NRRL Y-17841) TaxID=573826 RepID=B9WFI6_CANDC|nr:conserved hypothetical protein [Candida dubliniensis CD36]CAX42005.1 conserved hypothetical protein [Candida dubliniensis CD36]